MTNSTSRTPATTGVASEFTKRANDLVREVWADLQRASRERELADIKTNPGKHRLTRIMSAGASTNYSYVGAGERKVNKRQKERTSFCVATHKNAAGVFLIWRQVDRYRLKRGKWSWYQAQRFDFQWAPTKREALAIARTKARRTLLDLAHEKAAKLPSAPQEARDMLDAAINSL